MGNPLTLVSSLLMPFVGWTSETSERVHLGSSTRPDKPLVNQYTNPRDKRFDRPYSKAKGNVRCRKLWRLTEETKRSFSGRPSDGKEGLLPDLVAGWGQFRLYSGSAGAPGV